MIFYLIGIAVILVFVGVLYLISKIQERKYGSNDSKDEIISEEKMQTDELSPDMNE